jgi:hypothetical protein
MFTSKRHLRAHQLISRRDSLDTSEEASVAFAFIRGSKCQTPNQARLKQSYLSSPGGFQKLEPVEAHFDENQLTLGTTSASFRRTGEILLWLNHVWPPSTSGSLPPSQFRRRKKG